MSLSHHIYMFAEGKISVKQEIKIHFAIHSRVCLEPFTLVYLPEYNGINSVE